MKRLFEFTVPKKETVKESTVEQKDGKEVTITSDVEKEVEKKYFLRKPTRAMFDDAELFFAVSLSEGIKAGLLTRALLLKRFNNDGGILSENEKESLTVLYSDIMERQTEFQKLSLKSKEERSEEEQLRYGEALTFLNEARVQLQEFEMAQSSLYDQTAENRARNKTILWWVLALSYSDEEGEEKPFFHGENYEQKLSDYDAMEEEDDDFVINVISKLSYYISFWYVSKVNTKEEFEELLKASEQEEEEDIEEMIEEVHKQVEEEIKTEDKEATEEEPKKPTKATKKKPKEESEEKAED